MTNEQCCQDCLFFKSAEPGNPAYGRCRRYPPIFTYTEEAGELSEFPEVHSLEWCGEFKARDEATI